MDIQVVVWPVIIVHLYTFTTDARNKRDTQTAAATAAPPSTVYINRFSAIRVFPIMCGSAFWNAGEDGFFFVVCDYVYMDVCLCLFVCAMQKLEGSLPIRHFG